MNGYKKLLRLGSIYSFGQVSEKALNFFFIPLYTAFLSPSDFGIIGLMSITVGLIESTFLSPIVNGFIRYYYSPEFSEKQETLVFTSYLLTIIQSAFLAVLFYMMSTNIAALILGRTDLDYAVKLYSLVLFFSPISGFCLNLIRMRERAGAFVFVSISNLLFTAAIILYFLIVRKAGFYALIYGNLFTVIYSSLVLLPAVLKNSKLSVDLSIMGEPLRYGYPLIFTSFSIFLIQSGDRYVLKILGSLEKVGLYSFGYSFAGIINILLTTPLKNAINPIVYKQEGDKAALNEFVRNSADYFFLLGSFVCLIFCIFGKELFSLMIVSDSFMAAWVVVPVIAFCYILHGLSNIFGKGPSLAKKSFHISGIVIFVAVFNIELNFIFIPHWGIFGAAVATLFTYIIWDALYIYYAKKFYDMGFNLKRLIHIAVIGVGSYLLSVYLFQTESVLLNTILDLLIVVLYIPLFFLTGFFTEEEKKYIGHFFSRIKDEGILDTLKRLLEKPV